MTPFKRCILHIGGEKTGSTSLQQALSRNRESLHKSGVYVPDRATFKDNNWGFVAIAQHNPEVSSYKGSLDENETHEDGVARLLKQYKQDFKQKAKGCDQLLVSSEHLQTLVNPRGIQRLLSWISTLAEECILVYVARRQDYIIRSLYSTALRAGTSTSFMFNPINFQRAPSPRLNHWIAVTRYLAYPKHMPVEVRVVCYEEEKSKRREFWTRLTRAMEVPDELNASEANSNPSLGLQPARFLTTLFHPTMAPYVTFQRPYRIQLAKLMLEHPDKCRLQPSVNWAGNVIDGYKHSNQLVATTFLDPAQELFDSSITDYPDQEPTIIGMSKDEFHHFIDELPGLDALLPERAALPNDVGFFNAIRERTILT